MTAVDLDYALLRKTSRGDQRAFAELMRRHQDRIFRLAWRLLRQTQEAEDATQEVFLKSTRMRADFLLPGRCRPGRTALPPITASIYYAPARQKRKRPGMIWIPGQARPAI